MDPHPHIPAPNHSNREVSARGIPWNGVEEEEEEEEDWSIDQSSGDEEDVVKEPPPYSRLHFDNSETRTPKNQHLFADDLEDDEEDELGKGDEEYEDEDDDGIDGEEDDDPDWDDNNRQVNGAQQQLERQQHNGSSQTDTSGEGEDGRNYYLQNDDDIYVDRLNAPEGIGGEEEFESPTEENHDQSGDQTEQEMIKAEEEEDEEQGEESGYNDLVSEPLREQGVPQDEDKDAEQMVPANPKTPGRSAQKRKSLSSMGPFGGESGTRKPKKKNTNVWTKTSSRKGSKKNKSNVAVAPEETAFITPVPRLPDKVDDSPDMRICLSKIYKAEKVELSEDRLTAGSTKGYRMVRATRGVIDGAWYFEIKIVHLGETGHTRLGWSTEKGDVQAPVGYDGNSYSYRDVDGSKVHKAVREPYGEGPYREGDVIGFYINLPGGAEYAPRPPQYVVYRGQLHCRDSVEEPPKIVPDVSDLLDFNSVLGKGFGHTCGSEISFFKNGICQGVAFKNINAGRYYPAASMYTLPNQPNCTVQFNFGPQFDCFPEDFGDRPLPKAMYEAPYCGIDGRVVDQGESLLENGQSSEKKV